MKSASGDGKLGVVWQRETDRKWSALSRMRYDDAVDYYSLNEQPSRSRG